MDYGERTTGTRDEPPLSVVPAGAGRSHSETCAGGYAQRGRRTLEAFSRALESQGL